MKINWKLRAKNPYFWFGLLGVILTAMGAKPEMFTSWNILTEQIKLLIDNPFMLFSVLIAVTGVLYDPTTQGLSDSNRALDYKHLGGDGK